MCMSMYIFTCIVMYMCVFHVCISLQCLKDFMKTLKAFIKLFDAPQRRLKIKLTQLSKIHGVGRVNIVKLSAEAS